MRAYDNDSPGLDDPRVVEALDEYLAALESGQKPDREEFLARNPAIAAVLADCLDGMEALHEASSASHSSGGLGAVHGDWQPGTPLGDYRIRREIGRGGMGVVYEAEQLSLGRRIALKVLPFALTLDPRQLQRFKNEARAAAQLHHQHIVPVYAVGTERGVHFYAMQYIEGQSLAEVIRDVRRQTQTKMTFGRDPKGDASDSASTGPYPPRTERPAVDTVIKPIGSLATSFSADSNGFYRTVARLGIQAAEALNHAHEYGVIHRDIKPGNLMVDGHGHLWVTDFGLAQFQSDPGLTQSGDLLGTLRYMSPEQANGQRVALDHRTDIYSLGATLYELLTQHPPFEGNDRQTMLHQILYDEPRPPRALQKSIPVELETIILKALAKTPAERYATAQELAEDLSRLLKDQPIRARRATAAQRVRKWARRHPSVFWAAVILCMLTAAGSLLSATMIHAAYERERKHAQEAKEDFELAREAVDGMFKLCEDELAGKPFLDGLRQRFLQDYFLVYYQKLIEKRHDDPETQAELSAARLRVLDILDNLAEIQGLMQYRLLNDEEVVRELDIDKDQLDKIRALTKEVEKRQAGTHHLSPQERFVRFSDDARWMQNKAQNVLNPDQRRRLRQIALQTKGARAFEEQDVIEKLGLDARQRERIRTIQAQAFQAAFGGCHPFPPHNGNAPPPPEDRLPPPPGKFDPKKAFSDSVKQIEDEVLTEKQRKQWHQLKGEPFERFSPPLHWNADHPPRHGRGGKQRP